MSDPILNVLLDRQDARYAFGDVVRATIRVVLDEPLDVRHLEVQFGWASHGWGSTNGRTVLEEDVHEGHLEPGEHVFHAEFRISDGPGTFRGELVNFDWYVRVHLKSSWIPFTGEKRSVEFLVDRGLGASPDPSTFDDEAQASYVSKGGCGGTPALITLVLFGIGSYFTFNFAWGEFQEGTSRGGWLLALAIVMMVGLGWGIYKYLRTSAEHKLLGSVLVRPDSYEPFRLRLRFLGPTRRLHLVRIRGKLVGTEAATRGSGTNRETRDEEFCEVRSQEIVDVELPAGSERDVVLDFGEIRKLVPSYDAGDNEIRYVAKLEIESDEGVIWKGDDPISIEGS